VTLALAVVYGLGAAYLALGARAPGEDSFGGGLLLMLVGVAHLAVAAGTQRGSRPARVATVLVLTLGGVGGLQQNLSLWVRLVLLAVAAGAIGLLCFLPPARRWFGDDGTLVT
jgi:hypothetical protein